VVASDRSLAEADKSRKYLSPRRQDAKEEKRIKNSEMKIFSDSSLASWRRGERNFFLFLFSATHLSNSFL
jgi:hypothetical protein